MEENTVNKSNVTPKCAKEKKKACNQMQLVFEDAYCDYAASQKEICTELESCFAAADAAWAPALERLKQLLRYLHYTFISRARLSCLGEAWPTLLVDGSLATASIKMRCKRIPDTSHLQLKYPNKPVRKPCVKRVVPVPGNKGWSDAEYLTKPWKDFVQPVTACRVFKAKCRQAKGWTYIFDFTDKRGKDDIPDGKGEIMKGFDTENAFFMGNRKLKQLDLAKMDTELCLASSSAACIESCQPISANSWRNNSCKIKSFKDPIKKMIAILSGQCAIGHHSNTFMVVDHPIFPKPHADKGWAINSREHRQCNHEIWGTGDYCKGGSGVHVNGWGVTFCPQGMKEILTNNGPGAELSYETYPKHKWTLDVDTMRIRCKPKAL